VGKSAFAHKGGIHVSAVMKDASTYEHIRPELIGNRQRVLLSDLSGRSNISYKLDQHGLAQGLDESSRKRLLETIKHLEHQGYDFEVAEGNFELLVLQELHPDKKFFTLIGFDVHSKAYGDGRSEAIASVVIDDKGALRGASATGHGPVDAMHNALRRCLAAQYPRFEKVKLRDYKVRVLDGHKGTGAKVRVLVEWADEERSWTTVGISDDIIQASSRAMVDAIRLELLRAAAKGQSVEAPLVQEQPANAYPPHDPANKDVHEAYGWGV
jgi:2-isopropylmalate synthase